MIIETMSELNKALNYQYFYPDQLVSKKTKEKPDWIKANMDYFASVAFSQYRQNVGYRKDYKLLNGEFNFQDYVNVPEYEELMDILTDSPEKDPSVPQHLKHYSILNPHINTLMGELIKRPHKFAVKALDDVSIDEVIDYRTNILREYVLNNLRAKLEGVPEEEAQQITEQELQSKILNYTTIAERWGNKALSALKYYFNFKEKSQISFKDFLVTGKEFHHFYPDSSRLGFSYKVENPSNVWYLANRNAAYTTDCWAIGTIEVLTFSEILSRYELDAEEIEHLKHVSLQSLRNNEYSPLSPAMPNPHDPLWQLTFESTGDFMDNGVFPNSFSFNSQYSYTVTTAYWESKRKIYKRTFTDQNGYTQTDIVSEEYELCKECGDIKLEEMWVNQWYRGVKIGADIYKYVEPLDFCTSAPIVGVINTSRNTQGKSLLSLMKPYQILYNICMNQLWELLEKEIGVVWISDIRVVPNKDSSDPIEQMLWTAKEKGTLFVDTSKENVGGDLQFNQMTRVDLTRSEEIRARIELARALREEAWELIGISRQRTGSVRATETATGTNTAMAQSYAQTEPWFAWHDNLLQKVYQTILEITQYIELKKPESVLNYLNSDLEAVFLKISREDLLRDLFVFVSSYSEDRDTIEQLKQLAQPAMQNGAELSEIVDIFTANSERNLRETLNKIQKRKDQLMQQERALKQQELDQKQEQFQIQMAQEEAVRKEEQYWENLNKQLDRENKLEIERLRGIANEGSFDQDTDLTGLLTEQTKIAQEKSRDQFDRVVKQKELKQKDRELDLKEKDIDTKLKVAKYGDKGKYKGKK